MQASNRIATAVATIAAVAAGAAGAAGPASADGFGHGPTRLGGGEHAVFVQTDNLAGNQVVAYDRSADGTLTLAGTYATGGLGGQLSGSVVDHLASEGSLVYDHHSNRLYAVNAGSNTISVFDVFRDRLALRQVIPSGGSFPVSIAVRDGLVYVLNALGGGSLSGFAQAGDRLIPIPGSGRPLGLDTTVTSPFVDAPGQAAFSRDGSQLIVTTKATGNDVDVFHVYPSGRLSSTPTVNALATGTVPFGISFDRRGHVAIVEAGTSTLATFSLHGDGTLTQLASVATGQAASCWVIRAGDLFFVSNAGSASLSGVQPSPDATTLTLLGHTSTDPGTVDATSTRDGRYVYVQTGANGIVDELAVNANGSLTSIGSVTVAGGAGGEGIAAS